MGPTLNIMNEDIFNNDKKIKEKRAVKADKRKIELVRRDTDLIPAALIAAYDLFEPDQQGAATSWTAEKPARRI